MDSTYPTFKEIDVAGVEDEVEQQQQQPQQQQQQVLHATLCLQCDWLEPYKLNHFLLGNATACTTLCEFIIRITNVCS